MACLTAATRHGCGCSPQTICNSPSTSRAQLLALGRLVPRPPLTPTSSSSTSSNTSRLLLGRRMVCQAMNSNRNPKQNPKQQMSRVEAFMRSTPGFNRFVDGTLLLGDVVMVLATQVSTPAAEMGQRWDGCWQSGANDLSSSLHQ